MAALTQPDVARRAGIRLQTLNRPENTQSPPDAANREQDHSRAEGKARWSALDRLWATSKATMVNPRKVECPLCRRSEEALQQLRQVRAFEQVAILDQIEQVLGVNPTLESKARVKRLRPPAATAYRLRVDDFRVCSTTSKAQWSRSSKFCRRRRPSVIWEIRHDHPARE